jgi:hypothetical protein
MDTAVIQKCIPNHLAGAGVESSTTHENIPRNFNDPLLASLISPL